MKRTSFLFCLLFAITANSFTTVKAQVDVNDSLALVDLYNSTGGPGWRNHTNWLTTRVVKSWHGVTVTNNRVTALDLSGNYLIGAIPASFGNLTNLQNFRARDNNINGGLPATIGNLVNLTYMSLANNKMTDSLTSSIGNLVNLKYLNLELNLLTGPIPTAIGNLISLDTLLLDVNHLSGKIPPSIGNLVNLRYLTLSTNTLNGKLPSSIGNLINLGIFTVQSNNLSGSIPSSIGKLKKLTELYLVGNKFTGSIPPSVNNLVKLQTLAFNDNKLTGPVPSFSKLVNLTHLYLNQNLLTQDSNVAFIDVPNPNTFIYLYKNNFTFNGLEMVAATYPNASYYQESNINIHQQGNTLAVSAGGTLSNNTYRWYKGTTLVATITGNSTFTPSVSSTYHVDITNAVATQLTLHSNNFAYTALQLNLITSSATWSNTRFSVYPNPAKDIVHVQVNGVADILLTNNDGKALLTKTINNSADINVSQFANGTYYIQNKTTGEVQKVVVVH